MKRNVRIIALCLVMLMIMTVLTACGKDGKFVGTWYETYDDGSESGTVLVLAKDGEGSIRESGVSGSIQWSVEKDKLFLTVSLCGMSETNEYTYKFSGKKMILTDVYGDETIYIKK